MTKKKTLYLLLFFVLLQGFIFGQKIKSIHDSVFNVCDIIKIPEIQFALDSDGHTNDAALKVIAGFINAHKNLLLQVSSHTDSRGDKKKNQKLSELRAASLKDALVEEFGVDKAQLKIKGYGSAQLIISDAEIRKAVTNMDKEALHQQNRRIELLVIGKI